MKFLNNINLSGNELQNARVHNLASQPTGTEGLVYFNTVTKKFCGYANGTWGYQLTSDLLAAANGVATLNGSALVVQNPASAASVSGGNIGKIPVSLAGGILDTSYIPALNNIPIPAAAVNMNGHRLTSVGTPSLSTDAATKGYVDNAVQGLDSKASVKAASTGNVTQSGPQTVDGVSLDANDRVLLKNQTPATQNGIWVVQAGPWSRANDAASLDQLTSAFVFVEGGTVNADTGWTCTVSPELGENINEVNLPWVQFSAAGQVTAANVGTGTGTIFRDKVGTTLNIKSLLAASARLAITNNTSDITIDVNEGQLVFANMTNSGILAATKGGTGSGYTQFSGATTATKTYSLPDASCAILTTNAAVTIGQGGTGATTVDGAKAALGYPTKYSADIGNGSLTAIPVTHSFGTLDVQVSVFDKATGDSVYPDMTRTNINTVTLTFSVAPTTNQYRVVIVG